MEGKKGIRKIKVSLLVVALAIIATVVWGSVAAAQRNGSEGDKNSMYATTYIVAEAAALEEPAAPVEATVPAEAATPEEPVASVEEAATSVESAEITAEVVESVTEPAESTEIAEEAVESAVAPAEPVIVPAPVATSVEPVATPAELVVVPVETVVVSEAPVAAPAESVEITTGAAESSLVEFYDAKLNRLYIDFEKLSDADYETMSGILEEYGSVELYDYESQEKIEM